jgi:PTS system nitrogen regulatory IIA component
MDMGVKEAARFLGVSEKTIYRWLSDQKIQAVRVGAQYRFNRDDLRLWAESSGSPCAETGSIDSAPSLSHALRRGGIFYRVEGNTAEAAITNMAQLAPIRPLKADSLVPLLLEREAMETTAIGDGIALPHPRSPIASIRQPLLALGFLESPVDFHALDQIPVQAIFLLLSPTAPAHLSVLSRLSHMLRNPTLAKLIQQRARRSKIFDAVESFEEDLPDRS